MARVAPAVWAAMVAMVEAAAQAEQVWSREAGPMDKGAERPMPAEAVAVVALQTQPFTALIW